MFDITRQDIQPHIEGIRVHTELMDVGARCDLTLIDNTGNILFTDNISALNTKEPWFRRLNIGTEHFRIELNWANGSAINPLKIKGIKIYGTN